MAEQGDEVARELFARGAVLLGGQIAAVVAQTGLEGTFPLGLTGSAFKAGEVFLAPLRGRVAEAAPGAEISLVRMAPVGGSLLLAAKACGQEERVLAEAFAELIEQKVAA